MAPCLLITKSSPPSGGGGLRKINAAANAHQVRVNADHHKKAKDLDTRLGEGQGPRHAKLITFGQDGVILGPVVCAIGEMSSHTLTSLPMLSRTR